MIDAALWFFAAVAGGYVVAVAGLWWYGRRRFPTSSLREAMRVIPDVLRLLRRLLTDRRLPRWTRLAIALLVGYLISPVDLIPDFVPVVGFADDAVLVALVLRAVVRSAGPELILEHWPGSAGGLELVRRLAGLT